jgi:hypothetical protein
MCEVGDGERKRKEEKKGEERGLKRSNENFGGREKDMWLTLMCSEP